jgi:xanthine dehydrogenase YagR molybdenum-binding subunit
MTTTEIKPPGKYVGWPVDQLDGRAKTTGEARYAAEHHYPNLSHAALVYATVAGAVSPPSIPRPPARCPA